MNMQIKNYSTKLFLTIAAFLSIFTGITSAQTPNRYEAKREQLAERLQMNESKARAGKKAAVNLASSDTFQNGKDFTMAIYDAGAIDEFPEALDYTILDLVYLIDRLDGQPEAVELQKTMRSVVRGTASAAIVKADIEKISNTFLARQKPDQKWYFSAGKTSMSLMISTFMNEDANIKKHLTDLQALIKTAPKGTAKEMLDPMGALAKYIAQKTYTEEDYMAIFEGVGGIIDAATA